MHHNNRLIAGQTADFDSVAVRPFYHKLQQYCRFLAQSSFDGDDLVHEAILKAVRHYHPSELNAALLKKIAYHHWVDTVRRRKHEQAGLPLETAHNQPVASKLDTIELLLEKLTPKQAVVFLLKEGFAYKNGEIATLLGMAETAVKAALHRARKRLEREGGLQSANSSVEEEELRLLASILNDSLQAEDPAILIERLSELPSLQPASKPAMSMPVPSNLSTFCMAA